MAKEVEPKGQADLWLKAINDQKNESFAFDENNRCVFYDKDGVECTLELLEERDRFYLYSPLMPFSEDPSVMRRALEANLFQLATAGSVISVDNDSNCFVLSFVAKISDFSTTMFINQLCIFLATAHFIREVLQKKDDKEEKNEKK